jgi:anti-sigma B factor antagonist
VQAELDQHGDTVVVLANGEIDISCAGRLEAQLRGLLGCTRRLVLDLGDVHFMDCSGLHCVLSVHHASHAAGVEFVIVPGPPQVQRIFDMTKTNEILRFTPSAPAKSTTACGAQY